MTGHTVLDLINRLTQGSVVRRIQGLFMAFNWLIAILLIPEITWERGEGVTWERGIAALLALVVVQAWLIFGYANKGFPVVLDLVPFAGLAMLANGFVAADLAAAAFFNSLWVRILGSSWRSTISAITAYVAAYALATAVNPRMVAPEIVGQLVALIVTGCIAKVMSDTLLRAERSFRVQKELSDFGANLVAARGIDALVEAAATTALSVVPADEPAIAVARLGEATVSAERAIDGQIVLTPVTSEPAGVNVVSAEVRVASSPFGRVCLVIRPAIFKHVSPTLESISAELGLATERVLLTESLRRESQAKSQFLATMSHELRTPLNSILGFAQLLTSPGFDPLTTRQERFIKHIRESGDHLLLLINDVLDLSKVAAGRMRYSLEAVDVSELVEEAVAKVRPMAERKGVDLRYIKRSTGTVNADRLRAEEIVLNLLSNAVKFTPEGGRVVARHRRRGESIEVCIRDTGIGISPDQLRQIFEAFTQLDGGKTRTVEGSGLGLSLSRYLAEGMSGSLSAVSTLGKGSAFLLLLPMAVHPAQLGTAVPRPDESSGAFIQRARTEG